MIKFSSQKTFIDDNDQFLTLHVPEELIDDDDRSIILVQVRDASGQCTQQVFIELRSYLGKLHANLRVR